MSAYATPKNRGGVFNIKSSSSSSNNSKSSSNNSSSKNSSSNSNSSSDLSSKASKAIDKIKDWVSGLVDWIEVKLDRLERRTNDFYSKAEYYVNKGLSRENGSKNTSNYNQAKNNYENAISGIKDQITANTQGASRYKKQTDTIYNKYSSKLNGTDKKTLKQAYDILKAGGKIDINEYNENVRTALSDIQTWYTKYLDCSYAVTELNSSLLEYQKTLYNLPLEEASQAVDRLASSFNGLEAVQARLSAANMGGSTQAQLMKQLTSMRDSSYATMNTAKAKADKAKTKKVTSSDVDKAKKATSSAASKIKNPTKAMTTAINSGKIISTKGLKGSQLKQVKAYNTALTKQQNLQSGYNKYQNYLSANTDYVNAKSAYNTYLNAYNTAKKAYNSGNSLSYQNYLVDASVDIQRRQDKANQDAYTQAIANYQKVASSSALKNNGTAAKQQAAKQTAAAKKTGANLAKKYSKSLSSAQKKALNAGKTVDTKGIKDKKLLAQLKAYNSQVATAQKNTTSATAAANKYKATIDELSVAEQAMNDAGKEAATSQAELAQAIVEAEQTKFSNVSSHYENLISLQKDYNELAEKSISLEKAHGEYDKTSNYDTQIQDLNKLRSLQQQEASDLQKQLQSAMDRGIIKKNSDEWNSMTSQILEAQSAVKDYDIQIENLKQSKIDVYFEQTFDRAIKLADQFIDKLNTLKDLITDEMMYDYDTGKLTQWGALSIMMDSKELDNNISDIQQYVKKRQEIMNKYNSGDYGQERFNELMEENSKNIQSAIKGANSARQSILNVIKNQSKAELDAINKNIDARKKALQAKKDYYDYDKQLKSQTDELQQLDQQIAALDGVTDAAAKARKAQLEAQRKEAYDDLQDTVKDHVYSLQIDNLDKLSDQLQEDYEKYVNELSSNLEKMTEAINNCINTTASNTTEALALMNRLLKDYGLDVGTYDIAGKFASGTKSVQKDGLYQINEEGREIIVTRDGKVLMPLAAGEGVINHSMTENLMNMAQGEIPFNAMPKLNLDNVVTRKENSTEIAPVVQCPITIMGNANEAELAKAINKMMPVIIQKTSSGIRTDLKKAGY